MSVNAFLASLLGAIVLGIATYVTAAVIEDNDRSRADLLEVLVATEDIPACATSEDWQSSMTLERHPPTEVPEGALASTSVVSGQVMAQGVQAGDMIRAQMFTKPGKCDPNN